MAFNSLYWDFCFASELMAWIKRTFEIDFQFPLLGFLLCIAGVPLSVFTSLGGCFQFPLLGFLLCILSQLELKALLNHHLSIPFIGIFALHLQNEDWAKVSNRALSIPFIGIFALHLETAPPTELITPAAFQFPLLGFLLCI